MSYWICVVQDICPITVQMKVSPCKGSNVGQDCRMWLGVWGPVPHGHSSEWEIFSLWRWERSWQCPVLSLKIVIWAALSSWWMLSSSVPMSRCLVHPVYMPETSACANVVWNNENSLTDVTMAESFYASVIHGLVLYICNVGELL